MLFHSWTFAAFLAVVLPAYYLTRGRAQDVVLLIAGYVFYAAWDPRFCLLLALSTALDYASALGIARGRRRRAWLALSLGQNLGTLAFFKYYDFFAESLASAFAAAGWRADLPTLRLVLPLGISFYTFQSIAYVVDVYRGRAEAERDFVRLAVFVNFFPQLVSGPIERADELLPQLRRPRVVTQEAVSAGCLLFLIGLFKKLAIADPAAAGVEEAFREASTAPWPTLWKGAWLFAIQIYGDFSGYSDMARGVGRLLGVEMVENFRRPYAAATCREFWRRWHISLSRWLRDYLYIPLGGSRAGPWRTDRNLMLTMTLGGLWHGASWTFVAWGVLHGTYLVIGRKLAAGRGELDAGEPAPMHPLRRAVGVVVTLHLVTLAWIFFRAPTIRVAADYLAGLATFRGGLGLFALDDVRAVALPALLLAAVEVPQAWTGRELPALRWPWPLRGVAYAGLVILMLLLGPNRDLPYLYFQF